MLYTLFRLCICVCERMRHLRVKTLRVVISRMPYLPVIVARSRCCVCECPSFFAVVVPQPFLLADGFRLCRLDGTMTNKRRRAELKRFSGKGHKAGEGAEVRNKIVQAQGARFVRAEMCTAVRVREFGSVCRCRFFFSAVFCREMWGLGEFLLSKVGLNLDAVVGVINRGIQRSVRKEAVRELASDCFALFFRLLHNEMSLSD